MSIWAAGSNTGLTVEPAIKPVSPPDSPIESVQFRTVRIAGPDDALIQAVVEHRSPKTGWRIEKLDGQPEDDALVILDFDDGNTQGGVLSALRAGGFNGPVLIVGGDDSARDGAELMPRPVRLGVLLARIDAHGQSPAEPEAETLGPYRFIPAERILRHARDNSVIRLTELEIDLLVYLAEAEGALVPREQLLADVWGYSEGVDSHTVETHIWRLRQKIETDDPATRFLVTESGGYRLLVAGAQEE
jgi:DNA-binding response OmpR family regulator